MNALRSSMSGRNTRALAEDIVRKPKIVLVFYNIMKYAAKKAAATMKHLASTHDMIYELLPIEMEDTLRVQEKKRQPYLSSDYSLEYKPEDIYVYGGCALALYDDALHNFKEKHQLNDLEKRVFKHTTDIDLAWFPRVPDEIGGWVAISSSPAIVAMVEEFKIHLETVLVTNQKYIENLFRENLAGQHEIASVSDFTVHHYHGAIQKMVGVHSIKISFKVNGIELQLCEISIHDSASSQQYDQDHKKITVMHRMTEDPIYCPPNELVHLDVYGEKIPVPNIELYCKQQLFIFTNKLMDHQYQKSLVSFRRVAFVLYLLEQLSDLQNANEKTKVKKQIAVKNMDHTIDEIYEMINYVKVTFNKEIVPLCSGRNNDEAIVLLCGPMKQLKGSFAYSIYPRSKAENVRFMHHEASYKKLPSLLRRINNLIGYIERMSQTNRSTNLSTLLEEVIQIKNRIEDEMETPSENHRNLDKKIIELTREIDILYAKYTSLLGKISIQRLSTSRSMASTPLSASAAPFAPLPPLPPRSMGQLSTNSSRRRTAHQSSNKRSNNQSNKRSNNTRKNTKKN